MAHAQKCPICLGKGTILDELYPQSTCSIEKTCHGCNGRGWVEVGDGYNDYPEVYWPTATAS